VTVVVMSLTEGERVVVVYGLPSVGLVVRVMGQSTVVEVVLV
jgi:hypothetical protein